MPPSIGVERLEFHTIVQPLRNTASLGLGSARSVAFKARPYLTAVLDDRPYQACRWIRQRSALPPIAGESLISPAALERLLERQAFDIVNVRLSKRGGHLAGASMVERAAQRGLGYGFGAKETITL